MLRRCLVAPAGLLDRWAADGWLRSLWPFGPLPDETSNKIRTENNSRAETLPMRSISFADAARYPSGNQRKRIFIPARVRQLPDQRQPSPKVRRDNAVKLFKLDAEPRVERRSTSAWKEKTEHDPGLRSDFVG
jgi:hypothetical protein